MNNLKNDKSRKWSQTPGMLLSWDLRWISFYTISLEQENLLNRIQTPLQSV